MRANVQSPQGMTEESLGRAIAVISLAPIAEREADQRDREERERLEQEDAERRAAEKARRAEARARFRHSATRELWLVAALAAGGLAVTMGVSLPLTFLPSGADFLTAIAATWHYQWLPAAIGAGVMVLASLAYDGIRAGAGKLAWSEGTLYIDFMLLCLGLPWLFMQSAAQEGSIPPSAWACAPLVVTTAFVLTLGLRLLADRIEQPNQRKLALTFAVIAVLGVAWLVAPRSDVPSVAEQRKVDRRLIAAVPMGHCSRRSIAALPAGLYRNSLDGLVGCHQGRLRGKFMAFRNQQLLDVYVSQRKHAVEGRGDGASADECPNRAPYSGSWHRNSHPNRTIGSLLCYGSGRHSTLAWEDPRTQLFASITGRSRIRLYRWWREHTVRPRL